MTPIYHITHVDNLSGILASGRIFCERRMAEDDGDYVSIGHRHIKDRRRLRAVRKNDLSPLQADGTVWDYVPFYFAPRSPMLYVINRGGVKTYQQGQKQVVHLVTTVKRATALGRPWCFTDGHAEVSLSDFYDEITLLDSVVDWELMRARYWHDTVEDNDRSRRRQAEFLVKNHYPWNAITRIGVINDDIRRQVELILRNADHKPEVAVETGWYY